MWAAFAGDTHGNISLLYTQVHDWEKEHGKKVDVVFQVGDFGIWPLKARLDRATEKRAKYLEDPRGDFPYFLNNIRKAPCHTYFCRGNHEDQEYLIQCAAYTSGRRPVTVAPFIKFIPDGCVTQVGANKVAALGGNFSAKTWKMNLAWHHQQGRRRNHMVRKAFDQLMSGGSFDILLTHDAPSGIGLVSQDGSEGCPYIRELIEAKSPRFSFSGHWHHRLEYTIGRTHHYSLDKTDPSVDPSRSMVVLEI